MEYTFMFKLKLLTEDFFNICIKRNVEIKKLDKLPKLDNNYLLFITKYQEVEIIPDISLFNYEEALNEKQNPCACIPHTPYVRTEGFVRGYGLFNKFIEYFN